MQIILSFQSGVPIYEQIKEQVKASILSGKLSENEVLPSIRQLAKDLKVSIITTSRAYNDLELEGFLQTIPGKGFYVKRVNDDLLRVHYVKEVETALAHAVRQGNMAGLTTSDLHQLLDKMGG